jgi:penicillin-binding protein 1B
MVGGREYGVSQFNRAVQAQRQPGSAFKPIVALAALERQGNRDPSYTLASMVPDEPLSVRSGQAMWQPANFDGEFRGEVTLREAMEQSLNVPFARIGMEIGPQRIVQTAKRLGISSPMQPVPALALGASEVSLLELVRAYGVLAAEGRLAEPRPIVMVVRNGNRMNQREPEEPRRVADRAAAWLVTSALEGVVDRGTGRGLRRGGIAGKTGTSNDFRDAWFVAYTPELVVGVWVGHDDGQSLLRTGSSVAVPIVARFLDQGRVRSRGFPMPDGIEEGRVGGGWFGDCGETEYFLEGTAPRRGACLNFDLDGLLDLFRGGDDDDDDDDDRRRRDTRRGRSERIGRSDLSDLTGLTERAVRQAEEWLRERSGEDLEKLMASLERRIQRGRPR